MDKKLSDVLVSFFYISNQIKLYHWQTMCYARHKATDELFIEFNELIDKFVEVLTGRLSIQNNNPEYRILIDKNQKMFKLDNLTDDNLIIEKISSYLESNEFNSIIKNYSELITIKDEMLIIINKTKYLFSLK
jgi:hypothetical protein